MSLPLPQVESAEPVSVAPAVKIFRPKNSWSALARTFYFCVARSAFAAFLMVTGLYCLLVWVPFSNFSFIQNPPITWIPTFVRFHPLIYGLLLLAVAFTLGPDLRRKETRRAALAFLLLNAGAFFYVWRRHSLASLEPDISSYVWSMVSLLPLAWLAALDLYGLDLNRDLPGYGRPSGKRRSINFAQTTLAAALVAALFAAASSLRGRGTTAGLPFAGFAASLCFHLVIFTVVGAALILLRRVAAASSRPATLDFVLLRMLVWFLSAQALRTIILPTISFDGTQATIFSVTVSGVAILFGTGFAVRLRALLPDRDLTFARVSIPVWLKVSAALGLLAVAAYGIPPWLGPTDWDFVFQRIAVIAAWLLALKMTSWTGVRMRGKAAPIAVFVVVTAAAVGFARYARSTLYTSDPSPTTQSLLDAYAGADISFKTAYDVVSHPVDNQAYRDFYEFLKHNTNLGHDAVVAPVDTRLVSELAPAPGAKPNIFLFVIDSLRQDYVGPYNPAVHYTPEIDRFAKDSVVLQNAFTRYGGTALSEPAIWVGAMQLHKQFIEPFAPMNNLQKLLETDGYQSYISTDPLLRTVLAPSPSITGLDERTHAWSDLDFVTTLKELETKIDERSDRAKPIFAYSQPQNVHTITLARSHIPGGRKAVSIYELGRMDAAFGEFLGFLRQRGLYDDSIVILTADHGDSYGEYGRYGHSDFLFPEIIRIPMIVHLPEKMREQYVVDTKQPAFTTDITPSLFYLLGHKPILNNEVLGRPLFTQTTQEAAGYKRSHYLIVCSYAPVYAILGAQAQSLFIVDAVHSKSYYYNLIDDPAGTRSHLTAQALKENETLIRRDVGLIDDFYHWQPPK
jgi:hypothetical protein